MDGFCFLKYKKISDSWEEFFWGFRFPKYQRNFFSRKCKKFNFPKHKEFSRGRFFIFLFFDLGLKYSISQNIRVPFFLNIRIAYSEKIQEIFSGQIFFIFSRLGLKSAPSSCILYYQLLIKTFSSHIVNKLEKHKRLFCGKNLFLIFIE